MPSRAYHDWDKDRSGSLDEIANAHKAVGGAKRGRRHATQQINRSYAVLLASQFQGYCRDLHTECVEHLVQAVSPSRLQPIVRAELTGRRQLDRGNAQAASIGSDFGRLGVDFWKEVEDLDEGGRVRKDDLNDLNSWRNAIVHQDFDPLRFKTGTTLRLDLVRRWRASCDSLALAFDKVMRANLQGFLGVPPW